MSDRSVASSLAYQGGGRGLGVDEIGRLNDWATGGRRPDVYVLLVVEAAMVLAELAANRDLKVCFLTPWEDHADRVASAK